MKLFILLMIALLFTSWAVAWETDQYTLPTEPIAETGEEVSNYIFANLQASLQLASQYRINYHDNVRRAEAELAEKKEALKKMITFSSVQHAWSIGLLEEQIKQLEKRLSEYSLRSRDFYQTPQGMALLVAETLGKVISDAEKKDAIWGSNTDLTPYSSGIKIEQPTVFYPGKLGSIYAYAGFHRVLHPSHFVLSSTIKLYGIDVGMDKLGHLFNEGFQYYQQYHQAKRMGDDDNLALQKSISWGVDTENTYYGRWVSGIYSNADLASNYAGFHFYLNLFSPITLNGVIYPAILLHDEQGDYQVNTTQQNQPERLLKRFVSYHMNEALNPSSLEYLQYVVVKEAIINRCLSWQKKYVNPDVLNEKIADLARWNGDEYGFDGKNTISIYERCFH